MVLTAEEWDAVRLALVVAARAAGVVLSFAVLMAYVMARFRFPDRAIFNAPMHLPMMLEQRNLKVALFRYILLDITISSFTRALP